MIDQICAYIHNYFTYDRYSGTFIISNGTLTVSGLVPGQYFRIMGSRFNDGVHSYPASDLTDETFSGVIWDMRPPRAFLDLVTEIETWQAKYGDIAANPYESESFGGYSYQKAKGYSSAGGGFISTWQQLFASRLNEWRKLA